MQFLHHQGIYYQGGKMQTYKGLCEKVIAPLKVYDRQANH